MYVLSTITLKCINRIRGSGEKAETDFGRAHFHLQTFSDFRASSFEKPVKSKQRYKLIAINLSRIMVPVPSYPRSRHSTWMNPKCRLFSVNAKVEKLQHPVFPCGHPPRYWLSHCELNFGDRNGIRCVLACMAVAKLFERVSVDDSFVLHHPVFSYQPAKAH
jgi:hypothetical protein